MGGNVLDGSNRFPGAPTELGSRTHYGGIVARTQSSTGVSLARSYTVILSSLLEEVSGTPLELENLSLLPSGDDFFDEEGNQYIKILGNPAYLLRIGERNKRTTLVLCKTIGFEDGVNISKSLLETLKNRLILDVPQNTGEPFPINVWSELDSDNLYHVATMTLLRSKR